MLRNGGVPVCAVASRGLEEYHLHLWFSALNPLFDLFDRLQNITSNQIVFKLHVRVNQNLFWRQVHRQQFNHVFDVGMTFDGLLDGRNLLRIGGFTQQQTTRCTRQNKSDDCQHQADGYRSQTVPVSSCLSSHLMVGEPEPGESNHDSYQRSGIFKEHCLGRRILRLAKVSHKTQAFMVRLFNFLVDRQSDRAGLQDKRDREYPVSPHQVRWRMRMCEFVYALIDRVGRTNAKDENSCNERPKKPFFSETKRVLC